MTLGTLIVNGGKYVKVSLENATEDGVIETTLEDVDEHLRILDLRGTGLDPDEISFAGYTNEEQKIYTDRMRLSQTLRNAGRYVTLTFEGEPASIEKENLDCAFSTGGLVCGADMSVFTGIKSINGINEDNETCDLENLDVSNVVHADDAFRNSGIKEFILSDYPKAESMKGIIDGCSRLKKIIIDGCTDENLCESVSKAVKASDLEVFSAEDVDLIEELDLKNATNLLEFRSTGLGLKKVLNLPDLANVTSFKLCSPLLTNITTLEVGKEDGPLEEIELQIPSLTSLQLASGILNQFDGSGIENVEELRLNLPRLIKADFHGTEAKPSKLRIFDVHGNDVLVYLDVSWTQIETLDVSVFPNMQYVAFDSTKKDKKMIEGWIARNCKKLKTAKMLEKQAHPENDDLSLDNNSLEGCSALTDVRIITDGKEKMSGHEVHYSKVDFENDITFKGLESHYSKANFENDIIYKGSLLEDLIPDSPLTEDYLIQLIIKNSGILGELRYFPDTDFHRGFLYCDGSVFLPEVYPDFFALWKIHFEKDCGYDRFGYPRLPDYRGMFIRGAEKGRTSFSFQKDAIKKHEHLLEVNVAGNPDGWGDYGRSYWSNQWGSSEPSTHAPARTLEDETRPKNVASNIFIKVV